MAFRQILAVAALFAVEWPVLYWLDHGGRAIVRSLPWDAIGLVAFFLGMALAFVWSIVVCIDALAGILDLFAGKLDAIRDELRSHRS